MVHFQYISCFFFKGRKEIMKTKLNKHYIGKELRKKNGSNCKNKKIKQKKF